MASPWHGALTWIGCAAESHHFDEEAWQQERRVQLLDAYKLRHGVVISQVIDDFVMGVEMRGPEEWAAASPDPLVADIRNTAYLTVLRGGEPEVDQLSFFS